MAFNVLQREEKDERRSSTPPVVPGVPHQASQSFHEAASRPATGVLACFPEHGPLCLTNVFDVPTTHFSGPQRVTTTGSDVAQGFVFRCIAQVDI